MSCNNELLAVEAQRVAVSIPIGFSNELQPRPRRHHDRPPARVSIPIGFSNELQHIRLN